MDIFTLFRENLRARGFALILPDFSRCGSAGPGARRAAKKKPQELAVFFPKYSIKKKKRDVVR